MYKLVLDIETIIDEDLLPNHCIVKDGWPDPICWKVIAIGLVFVELVNIEGNKIPKIKYLCCGTGDEKEILRKFWSVIDKYKPQVVTWNGRSFDIPVLIHRALKFNLNLSTWFQMGDKWNNYKQRYSENWHLDLMDVMSSYGACQRTKQDIIAKAIGLSGKINITGDLVQDLFLNGKILDISNYCESDVLNLYGIFLRWSHVTGNIESLTYKKACDNFFGFIKDLSFKKDYVKNFIKSSESFFENAHSVS